MEGHVGGARVGPGAEWPTEVNWFHEGTRLDMHDRKDCGHRAEHPTAMPGTSRVFEEQSAACGDLLLRAITSFKFHFPRDHNDPHSDWRRMKVPNPPIWKVQEPRM